MYRQEVSTDLTDAAETGEDDIDDEVDVTSTNGHRRPLFHGAVLIIDE